jgi:hypothetical protein
MKEHKEGAGVQRNIRAWLIALVVVLAGVPQVAKAQTDESACDRSCMAGLVDQLLASMVAHNPDTLPLANVYSATENSHPAALGMMTLWRTVTKADKPSLLAIDTSLGQAYFALAISEAGSSSVLWGRIKVVDRRISEMELFINRSRGDHGFSFSADQLPANYKKLMNPPADRQKATHEELVKIARASFDASDPLQLDIGPNCQFTELGWQVIDPGLDDMPQQPPPGLPAGSAAGGFSKDTPLGCMFPPFRPTDLKARVIAIDDELGFVVVAGVVPGYVYPYPYLGQMLSAFIPSDMKEARNTQQQWFETKVKAGKSPLLRPSPATGETMQVLQFYDGKLQASQINVYLSGPDAHSPWIK